MFDLERAVDAWRRRLEQAGLDCEVIQELESHLREELDHQAAAFSDPAAAFDQAVKLLGEPVALREEFVKSRPTEGSRRRRLARRLCFVSAGAIAAINGWTLIVFDLDLPHRLRGSFAVAATALYVMLLPLVAERLARRPWVKALVNLAALWPVILLLSLAKWIDLDARPLTTLLGWLFCAAGALTALVIMLNPDRGPGGTGAAGRTVPRLRGPSRAPRGNAINLPVPPQELESPGLLAQAALEADHLGHDFIGTEHVLLALLKENRAPALLHGCPVDYAIARAEIERWVASGAMNRAKRSPTLTPRARKAFEIAAKEARRLNQTLIKSEHILSGLILEGGGVAARVLTSWSRA